MNIEEIDKWLDNEYGCSYTRLEELHDFVVEQDLKHRDEIERLKNKLKLITKIIENEKVSITMLIGGVGIVDKKQDFLNLLGSDKE